MQYTSQWDMLLANALDEQTSYGAHTMKQFRRACDLSGNDHAVTTSMRL